MKKILLLILLISTIHIGSQAQTMMTKNEANPMSKKLRKEIVSNIGKAMQDGYVFPKKGLQINEALNKRLKAKSYDKILDIGSLVNQIQEDIQAIIHDVHLRLIYFPPAANFNWVTSDDSDELKKETEDSFRAFSAKQNHGLPKLELLEGNVGYLKMASFNSSEHFVKETVASAMQFLENTDAIIIDVRNNGGGQPEYVNLLQSYFFPEKTLLSMKYEKATNITNMFYSVEGIARKKYLDKPLYVLTDNATASAAEVFAYGIQSADRGVIIGEKSLGGAHGFTSVNLSFGDNGNIIINIPDSRMIDPNTRSNFEGVGVIPSVPVKSKQALLEAHQLALEDLLEKTDNSAEKAEYNQIINKLEFQKTTELSINSSTNFEIFVGKYEIRVVLLEDGVLKLQRGNGPKYTLNQVGQDLFDLDVPLSPQPQFQFVKENGKVTGFNLNYGGQITFSKKENN